MSNIVGTATIKIIPDTAGFSAALNGQLKGVSSTAQKSVSGALGSLESARASLGSFGESLSRTGQRAILAGGAMTYGLTRPLIGLASTMVNTAAEFEKSMNTLAAVADIDLGSAELGRISDMARDLAKTFPQDANQIAKGLLDLARAGLDTADQLDAVIEPVMRLATIEDVDLATASDLLVNVFTGFGGSFTQFGQTVKEASTIFGEARTDTQALTDEFTRMGDILATVSAATTTDLVDLGNAFRYAGPVAATAGLSFQETASALGILAQAGFNATVGGTALRGIITRLAIPTRLSQEIFDKFGLSVEEAFAPETIAATGEAAEETSKILRDAGLSAREISDVLGTEGVDGIEAFNSQLSAMGLTTLDVFNEDGQMKPLQEVVDRFVDSGARVGDVMKLFGQRSGPAFLALMAQAGAFKELTAEVELADGSLEAMSDKIEQSAAVKFQLLKNAIVDLAISVGESGVLDFFAEMAISVTEFVQSLSDTNPEIVKWVFVLGGLVAVLGPATLIFGLWADSMGKLASSAAFLLGPVGAIIGVVVALAAAFGFMYSQSESLRAAVAVLGESLSVVFGPILDVGRAMLAGFAGGVGNLAETLGNALAPRVIEVAEAINAWVSGGGLAEFLTGVGEKIVEVAGFIYDLVRAVQDLGIMGAIGDAWQRIWATLVEFAGHFDTVLKNLLPTLKVFAEIIGTGIAIGIRVAWQAGAALLSVLEKVLDIVGPLISFLGDHLVGSISLLVAGFLIFGRALTGATLGLTRLGAAAGTNLARLATGLETAGLKAGIAGQAVGTFAANVSARMDRSAPVIAMVGAQFDRLGQAAQRVGGAVFNGLAVAGNAIRTLGVVATNVLQNASLLMAGFFGGQMAARADDLGGAITALIPTFIAMGIAITAGLGPAGALLAVGTALAAVLGMITGRGEEASKVIGLNIRENIDSLTQSISALNGELEGEALINEFASTINEINPRNFTIMQENLEKAGFTIGDLSIALDGGAQSASDFSDKLASAFANKNLTGELESFNFVLRGSGDALDKFNSSTQNVSGEFAKNLVESGKYVEILDKNTGEVIARVDNLNDLTGVMTGQFQEAFGGQLIKDFGVSLDEARLKYEAMKPLLELQQRNQDYINDKAKTWVDRIDDANRSLDQTKSRMRDLFAPADDALDNIIELFEAVRMGKDAIINPSTGQPWEIMPAPETEAGAKYYRAVQDIKELWVDTQSIIATGINPALDDATKIDIFKSELLRKRIDFVNNLSTIYQITPEQATALADQIAGVLPTDQEINVILGIDEAGIETIEAQYAALQERFKLDTNQVKVFAEFQLDPMSAEADKFARIIAGIDDIPPLKLDAIISTLDQMDPALRDWVKGLIAGGQVGPKNIVSFIDLIPRIDEAGIGGVGGATLAALLSGEDPETIQQFIDLIPRVTELTGFTPEDTASIMQVLIGKSPEDIQKFIDIQPSIKDIPELTPEQNLALSRIIAGAPAVDAEKIIGVYSQLREIPGLDADQQLELARILGGKTPEQAQKIIEMIQANPDMFAEILPLLAGQTTATAQLIIDVVAQGDVSALLTAAEMVAAAQFAVNGGFIPRADGTITTGPEFALIGEDGPEAVIPLTKPNRALQLLQQSGLAGLLSSAPSGTTTLGGTPPVLPAGTFQSVTPAAEGYAAAIWATGAASGFSTEAQEALAAQMGFPMDTTPIDEATAKVDGLTAALERARNLMEIMAASNASGVVSEDDPRWDWMTMGNKLGPGGLTADQYNALDPAIQALLDQANNYAEAVNILDDYGFTDFAPGKSPVLSGVSGGMSLLQPPASISTPERSMANNTIQIGVTVEATPGTTPEHAARIGEAVGNGVNRKLNIKSAIFSS